MPLQVFATNSIGAGTRVDLDTDDALIAAGAVIATTDFNRTIEGVGSGHSLQVFGTVSAFTGRAIAMGDDAAADSGQSLFIGSTGVVTNAATSAGAVAVLGSASQVINYGQIHSTFTGVFMGGTGAGAAPRLLNFGTIHGDANGVLLTLSTGFVLENRGTISSGTDPDARSFKGISASTNSIITNYGLMIGGIEFGSGNDTYRAIGGTVNGSIDAGGGLDTIFAGAENNSISGGADNDRIDGGGGNDEIDGGTGDDVMAGGLGDDVFAADSTSDTCTDSVNGGTDRVVFFAAGGFFALSANIENLTLGGAGAIGGVGNALSNLIEGNAAANQIDGLGGADLLRGGDGSDTYAVDNVADIISEANANIAVGGDDLAIFSGVSGTFTLAPNVERLTLAGSAAINGTGNALVNIITGNGANNVLNGGADNLVDTLIGGAGNDTYVFGGGVNEAVTDSAGVDRITSSGNRSLVSFGTIENLTLTGANAINGTGNALNNLIIGNDAINTLNGGDGNDILSGKLGNDLLNGGAGTDFFLFDTAPNSATNRDTINGFSAAQDTIRLENAVFTVLTTLGTLNAAQFKNLTTGGAVDASDRILYDDTTGVVSYDRDGSGAIAAVQFAVIAGAPTLTQADFVVV